MYDKLINGDNWAWIKRKESQVKRIADFMDGYAARMKMLEVHRKIKAGELCLADDGYVWYTFLPDNALWCLTALCGRNEQLLEWYIDITDENGVNEAGIPFCRDLYLDIAIHPDGTKLLLDEDELEDALAAHEITRETYDKAYRVRNEIIKTELVDVNFLAAFTERMRALF